MRDLARLLVVALALSIAAPGAGQGIFWRETFLTFDTPFASFDDRDPRIAGKIVVWRRFDSFSRHFDLWLALLGRSGSFTVSPVPIVDAIPSAFGSATYHLRGESLVWSKGDSVFHRDFSNGTITEVPLPQGVTIRRDTLRVDHPYLLWGSEEGSLYVHDLDASETRRLADDALFPAIDAPWAAWTSGDTVFLQQLEEGSTTPVATGQLPALDAPHIVFRGPDVLLHYDIDTENVTPLPDSEGLSEGPLVDGSHVLWSGLEGSIRVIRLHDLAAGITKTISDPDRDSFRPALSGRNALFIENQDDGSGILYGYDIPSQTRTIVREGLRDFSGPHASHDSAVHRELREVQQVALGDIVWVWRDDDLDGEPNDFDNCHDAANPEQRDSDEDGFGNVCDPDLNGDGIVDFLDLALLRAVFGTDDPDADFDGDGSVGNADLALLKQRFFTAPGPAGSLSS